MAESVTARRIGYDVDDSLVGREWVTRFGGYLKAKRSYSIPMYTPNTLPVLDHTPSPVRGVKSAALFFHARRKAIPGVSERLNKQVANGDELFAISGRPATLEWHATTVDQFKREAIPIDSEHIILTPLRDDKNEKVATAVSKADAIKTLGIEEFSDDDSKTILVLSTLFPDMPLNWIRYSLTPIPVFKTILATRPNVREISIEDWMAGK